MPQTPTMNDLLSHLSDTRRDVKRATSANRQANKSLAQLEETVLAFLGVRLERHDRKEQEDE